MGYRIMTVDTFKPNDNSTYKYLKVTDAMGNLVIFEAATEEELKTQVELMLNGNYAKKDFIIVQPYDYELDTNINESSGDPSGQP